MSLGTADQFIPIGLSSWAYADFGHQNNDSDGNSYFDAI